MNPVRIIASFFRPAPDGARPGRWGARLALLLLLLVTVLFCSPMFATPGGFTSGDGYRAHDWFIAATHDAIFRDTVLNHGQLPLRSHLVGGGYPIIGHPSDGSYSPFILTSLALGERVGLKLNLIICLFLGGLGVLLLSRDILRVPGNGPLFAAIAFTVAGWHPSRTLVGYYEATFYLLFPLMLYLVLMAGRRYRYLLLGVGLSACCLMQVLGGAAAFAIWAAAHILLGARRPELRWPRRLTGLGALALVLGLAVLLGAVKFLPAADLMSRGSMDRMPGPLLQELPTGGVAQFVYKRTFNYYTTYRSPGLEAHQDFFYSSPGELLDALVRPVALENRYEARPEGDLRALEPEYPFINIGYLALALGLLGLLLWRRRTRSSAWALLIFSLINFGWHAPVDLFRLLAYLPLVNGMARPVQYFNFFIYVELVLLAGAAYAWLEGRLPARAARLALLGLCLAGLVPSALDNAARYRQAFRLPMPPAQRAASFHQVKLRNPYLREQISEGYGNTYMNVLRGVGSVVWDSNIKMPEEASPRYLVGDEGVLTPNPFYRGEAWFDGPGDLVRAVEITPNRIRVQVEAAAAAVLTINQNADPGWSAQGGELLPGPGLLRVRCAAGPAVISLSYRSAPFYRGLAVSLLTVGGLVLLGVFRRRWWRAAS